MNSGSPSWKTTSAPKEWKTRSSSKPPLPWPEKDWKCKSPKIQYLGIKGLALATRPEVKPIHEPPKIPSSQRGRSGLVSHRQLCRRIRRGQTEARGLDRQRLVRESRSLPPHPGRACRGGVSL